MCKKMPFIVVNTHILPELRECKLEQEKYADTADFSLEINGSFPKGNKCLKKLFAFREKDGCPFIVEKWEDAPSEEGYFWEITEKKVILKVGSDRALLHACRTLKQFRNGSFIPCGKVKDYPRVPMRGFHTNLESCRQFEGDDVRSLLEKAGKFKLNTFLMEYNARFPFASHPAISSCNAFTKDDVRSFVWAFIPRQRTARDVHISPSGYHLSSLGRTMLSPSLPKFCERRSLTT